MPVPLPPASSGHEDTRDLLLFATDAAATLEAFFTAYPDCRPEALSTGAAFAAARFYDAVLADLRVRCGVDEPDAAAAASAPLLPYFALAERHTLAAVRAAVANLLVLPLQELHNDTRARQDGTAALRREELEGSAITALHSLLAYERCGEQLRRHGTLVDQLAALRSLNVESTQLDFAARSLVPAAEDAGEIDEGRGDGAHGHLLDSWESEASHDAAGAAAAGGGVTAEAALAYTEADVEQVRAIMPELGEGFVRACLQEVGNAERMINMLLEDRLPPNVARLPRDMPSLSATAADDGRNVFGHAEASMPTLDVGRLHRGKM